MWLSHPSFPDLVENAWGEGRNRLIASLTSFQEKAKMWNKEVFGNLFFRKRRVVARLFGIHKKLVVYPSFFLGRLEKELREE